MRHTQQKTAFYSIERLDKDLYRVKATITHDEAGIDDLHVYKSPQYAYEALERAITDYCVRTNCNFAQVGNIDRPIAVGKERAIFVTTNRTL